MYHLRSSCLFSVSLLVVLFVTGCSASFDPSLSGALPEPSTQILHASLYGGRQPITGAHVYMFAADATAYGHASDSLLKAYTSGSYPSALDGSGNYYVTTDANGAFFLSAGQYSCASGQQVYLYAIGGNAGGGTNPAAGLMTVLGQCGAGSSFPGVTFVTMNEISTVVAAYALSGYAVDSTHVAYPGTSLSATGIANAFANAGNLYNISVGGVAPTSPVHGTGTVPQALINALANSLAGCINSSGIGSPACNLLLDNALSGGSTGTIPGDTATAAINIAHYPGNAVSQILAAAPSIGAPYQPTLGATPNDLTIGITFTGGGLSHPKDIAVDGNGNVWVSSEAANTMTKLSPLGVPQSSTGYTVPDAGFIAIDTSNQAWVTSGSGNALYALTSSGSAVSGSPFAPNVLGTVFSSPQGIAIDVNGDILVASWGNSELFKLNASGTNLAGPWNNSNLTSLNTLAIDTSNDVWSASTTNDVCETGSIDLGLAVGTIKNTTSGLSGSARIAIDGGGYVWVTDTTSSRLTHYTSTTNQTTGSPYSGGGLNEPYGLGIDGLGNAWVANQGNSSVSEFSGSGTALSPSTGFTGGNQSGSQNLAIDGSGDVWVTNTTSNSVTELIGLAAPVITPLAAAVAAKTLGARP